MSLHSEIQPIMDRFNFEKVLKVMNFLNWKWVGCDPLTVDDLKATAMMCMCEAIKWYEDNGKPLSGGNCATGGFQASINVYDSGASLELLFYVDHAHSC